MVGLCTANLPRRQDVPLLKTSISYSQLSILFSTEAFPLPLPFISQPLDTQ